ncbi:MAG: transglycosylase domain-containing protein [Deltaproteobacteria bacterium]|nr:transglycosylase domain-containing protein [Deltaproteobacteria bacterium]
MRTLLLLLMLPSVWGGMYFFNSWFEHSLASRLSRDISKKIFRTGNGTITPEIEIFLGGRMEVRNLGVRLGRFDAFLPRAQIRPTWINLFNSRSILNAHLYEPVMKVDFAYFSGPSMASRSSRNALKFLLSKISIHYHNGNISIKRGGHEFHLLSFNGRSDLHGNLFLDVPAVKYLGKRGAWAGKKLKAEIRGTSLEKLKIDYLAVYTPSGDNYNFSGQIEKLTSDVFSYSLECFRQDEYFKMKGAGSIWGKRFNMDIEGVSSMKYMEKYFRILAPSLDIPPFLTGQLKGKAEIKYRRGIESIRGSVKLPRLVTVPGPLAKNRIVWPEIDAVFSMKHKNGEKKGTLKIKTGEINSMVSATQKSSGLWMVKAQVNETSCENLISWIPQGFMPVLGGLRLSGETGYTGGFSLDMKNPEGFNASGRFTGNCNIEKYPKNADVRMLKNPVKVILRDDFGREIPRILGPDDPSFTPLRKVPSHLFGSYIVLEDRRFMTHSGFDWPLIVKAVGYNIARRQFRKGASSISQQLVKNLYLTGDRTVSRKFEESIITWMLEKNISKKRIFELYLNVLEMGPNIRGIRDGSMVYFSREPSNLAPRMSVHLASITPAPRYYWKKFRKTAVPDEWTKILRKNLYKLYKLGSIKRSEFEEEIKRELIISDY